MRGQRFGEWVRSRRALLSLSQEELATLAGVSVRTVQNLEAGTIGQPRPTTRRLLMAALEPAAEPPTEDTALRTVLGDGRWPPPAQLPRDVPGFTGRERELAVLDSWLDGLDQAAGPTMVISGPAGVGKTVLAVHWAHQARPRFPHGQLYLNLRGFGPNLSPTDPADALRGLLETLGVSPEKLPGSMDAQVGLYRSLLAERRLLLLLDNARDAAQVRPLLPAGPTSYVVVTSRNRLVGLVATDGAVPISLGPLTRTQSQDLLAGRLSRSRLAAEPTAVAEITDRCDGLPLALAVVAARAAVHPGRPLSTFAAELREPRHGLAAFAVDEATTDVRTVFSWSYHALSPAAARLFRLLGLHPGPDVSAAAAASVTGVPPPEVHADLAELGRLHLLEEHTPGRYAFHDLIHAYARELAQHDEERESATQRLLDHYLHSAHAASVLLEPHREPIRIAPPAAGVAPERPANREQAMAWFTAEHRTLTGAISCAAAAGLHVHTWQLAWSLTEFLGRRGHWHDLATVGIAAIAAAEHLADLPVQARAHRGLAHAWSQLGQFEKTHHHLQRGLHLSAQCGDPVGQARSHLDLSRTYERQHLYADALNHVRQALHLYRTAGHRRGQAQALNGLGWLHAQLGEYEPALAHCRQALALHQGGVDQQALAATWDSLGYIHHCLGEHAEAAKAYQQALDLLGELGDRRDAADTLMRLGDSYECAGDADAARTAWRRALTILDELGHPDPAADRLRGRLATTAGNSQSRTTRPSTV